ncbi:hypothetical protein B0H14DRAFT_2630523 [Mycena olivaceomarginata]|nr:hypothetical protein B0H14DRAFT_2630523 [Mycena olivaceomarginata]
MSSNGFIAPPDGEVVYVQSFLHPFAHVIRSAILSTVCGTDDMPFGRAAELEKYVVTYLKRAAILYAISFEVSRCTGQSMKLDPSVYWCLSQAITFDYFLGKPTYGYVPDARESFLSQISLVANLANKARGPLSTLDVQLMPDFASLPQVPSWSRSRISTLESLQLINNWACENALLEDGIEQTQNLGRALEKSATYADMGGFLFEKNACKAVLQYESAYVGLVFSVLRRETGGIRMITTSVGIYKGRWWCPSMLSLARPTQQRPIKQLSRSELVVLWIHRARHLTQDLHHTTCIAVEEEMPEDTVGLIRDAVSVLLKNMVALGKVSLKYGSFDNANPAGYFVPPEGTTLFGMADCFVDLYGYHGDALPFDRALMFDNLNTLYRTMVLNKGYLRFSINFPNFDVSKVDLERYGIYEFIKPRQIARLSSEDPGTVVHQFGDHLLRYNPKLGDKARYQFPDPSCFGKRLSPIPATGAVRLHPHLTAARPRSANCSSVRPDKTLELVHWCPSEGWAAFLEFRLRPMVYFVHAAMMHDFTLIGAKEITALIPLRCTLGVHGRRLHPLSTHYRSAGRGDSNVRNNAQSLLLSRLPIQPGIVGSEPRPPDSSGGKRPQDAGPPSNCIQLSHLRWAWAVANSRLLLRGGPATRCFSGAGHQGASCFVLLIHPSPRVTRPGV